MVFGILNPKLKVRKRNGENQEVIGKALDLPQTQTETNNNLQATFNSTSNINFNNPQNIFELINTNPSLYEKILNQARDFIETNYSEKNNYYHIKKEDLEKREINFLLNLSELYFKYYNPKLSLNKYNITYDGKRYSLPSRSPTFKGYYAKSLENEEEIFIPYSKFDKIEVNKRKGISKKIDTKEKKEYYINKRLFDEDQEFEKKLNINKLLNGNYYTPAFQIEYSKNNKLENSLIRHTLQVKNNNIELSSQFQGENFENIKIKGKTISNFVEDSKYHENIPNINLYTNNEFKARVIRYIIISLYNDQPEMIKKIIDNYTFCNINPSKLPEFDDRQEKKYFKRNRDKKNNLSKYQKFSNGQTKTIN